MTALEAAARWSAETGRRIAVRTVRAWIAAGRVPGARVTEVGARAAWLVPEATPCPPLPPRGRPRRARAAT